MKSSFGRGRHWLSPLCCRFIVVCSRSVVVHCWFVAIYCVVVWLSLCLSFVAGSSDEITQIGTADASEFLEGGLLADGESFGLTATLNWAVSGAIQSKFILEYEDDVFVKSFVAYDPDRQFGF